MQSSSIDLFLQIEGKNHLFELKTSTPENVTGQCAKGLFQLGCYGDALNGNGYEKICPALVVETTGQPELDAYVAKILISFDVTAFFYYPEIDWPNRTSNDYGSLEGFLLRRSKTQPS